LLEINYSDLIFSIINFIVLLVLLRMFLYKPLVGFMEKRKEGIANSLAEAAAAREESVQLHERMLKEIEIARLEAKKIVEDAKAVGVDTKDNIIAEARKNAEAMTLHAQEEIEAQKVQAVEEIKRQMAQMVIMIAGRVLGEKMSAEQYHALVNKYIEEVGEKP